jgi:hypothetical protein
MIAAKKDEFECLRDFRKKIGDVGGEQSAKFNKANPFDDAQTLSGSLRTMANDLLEALQQVKQVESDKKLLEEKRAQVGLRRPGQWSSKKKARLQRLGAFTREQEGKSEPGPSQPMESLKDRLERLRETMDDDGDDNNDADYDPTAFESTIANRELQQLFATSRRKPRLPSTPSVLTSLFAGVPLFVKRKTVTTGQLLVDPDDEDIKTLLDPFAKLVEEEFKDKGLFRAIMLQANKALAS